MSFLHTSQIEKKKTLVRNRNERGSYWVGGVILPFSKHLTVDDTCRPESGGGGQRRDINTTRFFFPETLKYLISLSY